MSLFFAHMRSLMLIALALAFSLTPVSGARAAGTNNNLFQPMDINVCSGDFDPTHYTQKVVTCLKNNIIQVTSGLLQSMSDFMKPTSAVFFVLAIVVFGIRVSMGESQILAKGGGFLMRLGLVVIFSYNLNNMGGQIFDIEDELITLVSNGYSPWSDMDTFIGNFMGFAPQLTLANGMIGLLSASAYSGSMGAMVFGAGFMAICKLLMFVCEVIYAYVSAIMAIAFLIIISPIIIPLGVFMATETYVRKWTNTLLSAMLFMVILSAFLSMLMVGFTTYIGNIFDAVGGVPGSQNNFSAFYKLGQPVYSILLPGDSNLNGIEEQVAAIPGANSVQHISKIQSTILPQVKNAIEMNSFFPPGISLSTQKTKLLTFRLISLFLWASLMMNLLHSLPQITADIAGAVTGLAFHTPSLQQKLTQMGSNYKTGIGALGGGLAGGAAGAQMGKSLGHSGKWEGVGRQIGRITGAAGGVRAIKTLLPD